MEYITTEIECIEPVIPQYIHVNKIGGKKLKDDKPNLESEPYLDKYFNYDVEMNNANMKRSDVVIDLGEIYNKEQQQKQQKLQKDKIDAIDELDELINDLNNIDEEWIQPPEPPPKPPAKPMNGLKNLINMINKVKIEHNANTCQLCGNEFESIDALEGHYASTHNIQDDTTQNNMCRCIRCNNVFNNDADYVKHRCSQSVSASQDSMPVDPNGRHECPICKNKYTTANILGEHFIIAHNDYDELGVLDEYVMAVGFPGFDILEELYMIEMLNDKKFGSIIVNTSMLGLQ